MLKITCIYYVSKYVIQMNFLRHEVGEVKD
jgi:hypothetical protein